MSDICIYDLHKDNPTMSEVESTVRAYVHAFPEYEVVMDGDRYGIYARRRSVA